jgi:hypothetical protein
MESALSTRRDDHTLRDKGSMRDYLLNKFEILGSNRGVDQDPNRIYGRGSLLNGKETFKRLFIKRKI